MYLWLGVIYLHQINVWQSLTVAVLVGFPSWYCIKSWYLKPDWIKYLGPWKYISIQAAALWLWTGIPQQGSPQCHCIYSTALSNRSKVRRAHRSTHVSQLSRSFTEMKQSAGKPLASINSCSITDFARCYIAAIGVPLLHCGLCLS